ncbi:unnamed protein product [Amoebophrya sp. A25]|nr:unnamed protein product [Amoebophrya sp. A25]|eukprot:GSA25T00009333001.1
MFGRLTTLRKPSKWRSPFGATRGVLASVLLVVYLLLVFDDTNRSWIRSWIRSWETSLHMVTDGFCGLSSSSKQRISGRRCCCSGRNASDDVRSSCSLRGCSCNSSSPPLQLEVRPRPTRTSFSSSSFFVGAMKTKTEPLAETVKQFLDDECIPYPRPQFVDSLLELALTGVEAMQALHLRTPGEAFLVQMRGIYDLLAFHPYSAFECPLLLTGALRKGADLALAIGHRNRARVLLQVGNMFKLSAMSRWWTVVGEYKQRKEKPPKELQRFHPRMQMDYSLGLSVLTADLMEQPKPIVKSKWSGVPAAERIRPKIDVLSICVYKPDDTSNTVLDSPLPQMSPLNHRQYVNFTDLNGYFLHTSLLTPPDVEAHYSKFLAVMQHLSRNPETEWVFFIDCDAFFTDFDTTPYDLVETYGGPNSEVNFIVAEDTGGINTGVFMVRNTPWSLEYLERVTRSPYTTAWDQSMFFMEIVNTTLWDYSDDFRLPSEVAFLHQAHLNAFVPPASKDWQAYEWQKGDFARHFAGCPWQEAPCLNMMYETMDYVEERYGPQLRSRNIGRVDPPPKGEYVTRLHRG